MKKTLSPRAWDDDGDYWWSGPKTLDVLPDHQELWSGLYDSSGNKLYRKPNPIGYRPR